MAQEGEDLFQQVGQLQQIKETQKHSQLAMGVMLQGTGSTTSSQSVSPHYEESPLVLHSRPAVQQKVEMEDPLLREGGRGYMTSMAMKLRELLK